MTPPVFLAAPGALATARAGGRLRLGGPEGRHAATVRRIGRGETVELVDGDGARARCAVLAVARDALDLEVLQVVAEAPRSPRMVLVQALAKGDRGELAVELATEAGVDEVVPWTAARSVLQWKGERGEKALQRWRGTAREAAKQSRRAWWPQVTPLVTTTELVRRAGAAALCVVLHEDATQPLALLPVPTEGEVVLVVGPEGGLTEEELALLVGAGAQVCRLGPEVLRTSTAGVAALAVLSAAARWR